MCVLRFNCKNDKCFVIILDKGVMVMKKNKSLDMSIIKRKSSKTMSTEESLKDIKKIEWSEDTKSGKKKVSVNKACAK